MTAQIEFGERKAHVPRSLGGVAALVYPSLLVALSIGVEFTSSGGISGFGAAYMAALLFVIAAPTSWIFAIDFIEAGQFTVVAFGVVTSFPVWYLMGASIASGSRTWTEWGGRFGTLVVVWTVVSIVLVGLVDVIAG